MLKHKYRLMAAVVMVAAIGSFIIAVVDQNHRSQFMQGANASLGAWWALQKPVQEERKRNQS